MIINPIRWEAIKEFQRQKSRQGSGNLFIFIPEDHEGNKRKIKLIIQLLGIDADSLAKETSEVEEISAKIKSQLRSLLFLIHPDKREANEELLKVYGLDAGACDDLIKEFSELKTESILAIWTKCFGDGVEDGTTLEFQNRLFRAVLKEFEVINRDTEEWGKGLKKEYDAINAIYIDASNVVTAAEQDKRAIYADTTSALKTYCA